MFRLTYIFVWTSIFVFAFICNSRAAGVPLPTPSVPIIVEDNFDGLLPYDERNTCDPEFMKVLNNRAWESAQREITQNANLIARPDSILSLSCFDSWMNHLSQYAWSNFPGHPQESSGILMHGLMTELFVVMPDDILSSIDPNLTVGYVLYALLEILVMDQIQGGWPDLMIGNRAKEQTPTPAYSEIPSEIERSVGKFDVFNGCSRMNEVWVRAQCYDFMTESSVYKVDHSGFDHDGFYTLDEYLENSETGEDYRTEANQCSNPGLISGITWRTSYDAANPDPGELGAMDPYVYLIDLVAGDVCAPPIKLGFIVVGNSGSQYIDSVCPNPGCHFHAPSSIGGTGSCSH